MGRTVFTVSTKSDTDFIALILLLNPLNESSLPLVCFLVELSLNADFIILIVSDDLPRDDYQANCIPLLHIEVPIDLLQSLFSFIPVDIGS